MEIVYPAESFQPALLHKGQDLLVMRVVLEPNDLLSVHGSEPVRAGLKWNAANFVYNSKDLCPATNIPWNDKDPEVEAIDGNGVF